MTEVWANFFIAQCGASAALLGLLFVSVSLSLSKILVFPALPGRALMAMLLLLAVLLAASAMLIPGPSAATGAEILCVGVPLCGVAAFMGIRGVRHAPPEFRREFVASFAFLAIASLPYLAAGVLFLFGAATAPYWLAAAIVLSYLKAVLDAWVLLIEIHR